MHTYRKKRFYGKFWQKFKRATIILVSIAIVTFLFKEVRVDAAPDYSPRTQPASFEISDQKSVARMTINSQKSQAILNTTKRKLGTSVVPGPAKPGRPRANNPNSLGLDSSRAQMSRRGDDIKPPRSKTSQVAAQGNDTSAQTTTILNVKDADINSLIKTFSKLTGRNYVVDSNVKGKVTIHLPTPVTIDEALRILDSVLLLKGFTTVPIEDNTWKVIQAKDAKQTTIPFVRNGPDVRSDQLVTQLVRLKHVSASDMRELISGFVSKGGVLNAYEGTNSLIIIDSAANIGRLMELSQELDVPASDQDISIIPIQHAEAQDIADKINEILGEEEQRQSQTGRGASARTAARTRTRRGVNNAQSTRTGGGVINRRALPMKIIPDERTNSLIIVADEVLLLKIRALVDKLDSPLDLSGGRFHVYQLKHADSEELAEILNGVISGSGSSGSDEQRRTTGSSLSRNSRESGATNRAATSSVSQRIAQALRGRRDSGRSGANEAGRVTFEGEVSIAPDPSTNSLIINATRSDFLRLKDLLDKLDVKRRQVMVEATILEVSLNDEEGMGIELQGTLGTDEGGVVGQTNFGGLTNLLSNPLALTDLTIAAASSGTLTLPGGITIPSQAVLLSAVRANSNVNVLSSPTILTTDNQEAEIIVGENVPFVTSTSTDPSNLGNTFNQIERQDVGITLRITPQISTGNFVTLSIFVEISNVVQGTRNDPNGPTTTIRTTETSVEVKGGQMIVTGGLISDSLTESDRGVPFLMDIPVLGNYFRRDDVIRRRTNLLIFITPHIVKDQFDAREATLELRDTVEDVMVKNDINPNRNETLRSRHLDQVPDLYDGPAAIMPSTLVPYQTPADSEGKKALERTKIRLQQMTSGSGEEPARLENQELETEEDVIHLRVKPKMPSQLNQQQSKPVQAPEQLSDSQTDRSFVVMREFGSSGVGSLPFPYLDKQSSVGLVLNSSDKQDFFRVGRRYRYVDRGVERKFVCLGRYSSLSELKEQHPSLSTQQAWHTLSSEELARLGTQGWLSAGAS